MGEKLLKEQVAAEQFKLDIARENTQKMEEHTEFLGKAASNLTERLKNIRDKLMKHEKYASRTSANMTDTMQQTRKANQLLDEEISSSGREVEQAKISDKQKERD